MHAPNGFDPTLNRSAGDRRLRRPRRSAGAGGAPVDDAEPRRGYARDDRSGRGHVQRRATAFWRCSAASAALWFRRARYGSGCASRSRIVSQTRQRVPGKHAAESSPLRPWTNRGADSALANGDCGWQNEVGGARVAVGIVDGRLDRLTRDGGPLISDADGEMFKGWWVVPREGSRSKGGG